MSDQWMSTIEITLLQKPLAGFLCASFYKSIWAFDANSKLGVWSRVKGSNRKWNSEQCIVWVCFIKLMRKASKAYKSSIPAIPYFIYFGLSSISAALVFGLVRGPALASSQASSVPAQENLENSHDAWAIGNNWLVHPWINTLPLTWNVPWKIGTNLNSESWCISIISLPSWTGSSVWSRASIRAPAARALTFWRQNLTAKKLDSKPQPKMQLNDLNATAASCTLTNVFDRGSCLPGHPSKMPSQGKKNTKLPTFPITLPMTDLGSCRISIFSGLRVAIPPIWTKKH